MHTTVTRPRSLHAHTHMQVDATWHGHHHSYQRTCPAFRGRCLGRAADGTANGPVHLVIGESSGCVCARACVRACVRARVCARMWMPVRFV